MNKLLLVLFALAFTRTALGELDRKKMFERKLDSAWQGYKFRNSGVLDPMYKGKTLRSEEKLNEYIAKTSPVLMGYQSALYAAIGVLDHGGAMHVVRMKIPSAQKAPFDADFEKGFQLGREAILRCLPSYSQIQEAINTDQIQEDLCPR